MYGTPVKAATDETIVIRVMDVFGKYCDISKTYDVSDNNKPLYNDDGTNGPASGTPFVDFLEIKEGDVINTTIL